MQCLSAYRRAARQFKNHADFFDAGGWYLGDILRLAWFFWPARAQHELFRESAYNLEKNDVAQSGSCSVVSVVLEMGRLTVGLRPHGG